MATAPVVIGLTGGISSGKSAVAALLRARGAAVVDADELARQVVAAGQPALAEIVVRFGPEVLLDDGQLDRKKLGAIVFADATARADLGRITHPRIAAAAREQIAQAAASGARVVFYEAALLIENGLHRALDGVVVVAVPLELQRARLMARDGSTAEAADARIAAQLPLAEKLEAATWVIDNRGDRAALAEQVERTLCAIVARHGPLRAARDGAAPAHDGAVTPAQPRAAQVVLVTGFPSPLTQLVLERVLTHPPVCEVVLLVAADQARAAAEMAHAHDERLGPAPRVLVGDLAAMHLGLSSLEYRALAREVTAIHHLASATAYPHEPAALRAAILQATQAAIELAGEAPRLHRLVHWSSALASHGKDDRRHGASSDPRLVALRDAEAMVHANERRLPITVLRPSFIVGDSRTGEPLRALPWYRGLAALVEHLAAGEPPFGPLRAPPRHAHVGVVPADYLAAAAHALATRPEGAGRTFVLSDPTPMTVGELIAAITALCGAHRRRGLAHRALALARRLGHQADAPLALASEDARYDLGATVDALDGTELTCPTLADYLPRSVERILHDAVAGADSTDEPDDPLA